MTNRDIRKRALRALQSRGEWLAVAVVAVALTQALWATQWSHYPVSPRDMAARVAATRARMAAAEWPESERQRFSLARGTELADLVERKLRAPISVGELATSQRMRFRPGAERPPLTEPALWPVQELVASTERVLLPQWPLNLPAAPVAEPTQEETESLPDELRHPGGFPGPRPRQEQRREMRSGHRPQDEAPVRAAVLRPVRGFPFVAVRGLVDLPQQVRAYVDAIHQAYPRAERAFEILDFQLERQRLRNGEWSPWTATDRRAYFDVVRAAGGLEPEVIPPEATDSAITGPLPIRLTGRWDKLASHPGMVGLTLSKADLAREIQYLQALSRRAAQNRRNAQPDSAKRGFAELVRDVHSVQQSVFSQDDGRRGGAAAIGVPMAFGRPQPQQQSQRGREIQRMAEELAREIDPRGLDRQLGEWIRARATAERRHLLFRYLDFDVEPGVTYRYRVRLEVRNPNYGRPLAAAANASVIDGATRLTPWSEPTPAIEVDRLAAYYLTGLTPARRSLGVEAQLHIYQYDSAVGTTRECTLPVRPGQAIGGRARTTRVNPAGGAIEEGLFEFGAPDALVDGIADVALAAKEHPDLALPRDGRGRAFVPEMMLVLQPGGALQVVDTVTQDADYLRQQKWMQWQTEQFESLRSAGLDEGTEAGDEVGGMRLVNPLQRL